MFVTPLPASSDYNYKFHMVCIKMKLDTQRRDNFDLVSSQLHLSSAAAFWGHLHCGPLFLRTKYTKIKIRT